jgi:hypothetical protein
MITKTLPITKCSKVNMITQKQDLFLSAGREVGPLETATSAIWVETNSF